MGRISGSCVSRSVSGLYCNRWAAPCSPTLCAAMRWVVKLAACALGGGSVVSTTSRPSARSVSSNSAPPERKITSHPPRARTGRRNCIWKFRESVDSAPMRNGGRVVEVCASVASSSAPVAKMRSAWSSVMRPTSVKTNCRPTRSNRSWPSRASNALI